MTELLPEFASMYPLIEELQVWISTPRFRFVCWRFKLRSSCFNKRSLTEPYPCPPPTPPSCQFLYWGQGSNVSEKWESCSSWISVGFLHGQKCYSSTVRWSWVSTCGYSSGLGRLQKCIWEQPLPDNVLFLCHQKNSSWAHYSFSKIMSKMSSKNQGLLGI